MIDRSGLGSYYRDVDLQHLKYASNMRADKSYTDRRQMKQKAAQDEDGVSSSLLLTSLQQFLSQWPEVMQTTNTRPSNLKTNTQFLPFHLPQPGAAKAQTAKLSGLQLYSSQVLGLLSPRPSSLPEKERNILFKVHTNPLKLDCEKGMGGYLCHTKTRPSKR